MDFAQRLKPRTQIDLKAIGGPGKDGINGSALDR
jgi:hypothetical protein